MIMAENLRVLIVDDEESIRRFLRVTLGLHGYSFLEVANGAEVLKQAQFFNPHLILLDLGLPGKDGFEILRELRDREIKAPVIVLSVRDQEVDKIEALDSGADDYLSKPFSAGELLARLRAVARRIRPEEKRPVLDAGEFHLDTARHTAQLNGKFLHLTPTEYDVLKVLVLHSDTVVTRRQLLQEVWNNAALTEKSGHLLRVIISNLRDKVEPDPAQPIYILTEAGVGYRLCVPPLKVSSGRG